MSLLRAEFEPPSSCPKVHSSKDDFNRIKLESFALYKLNRACILMYLMKSDKM